MEALTIETFKTDKITAISVDDKSSGEFNYKSVKLAYDAETDLDRFIRFAQTCQSFSQKFFLECIL